MLLAAFRTQFPEFGAVDDTMAQAYLDAAALEVDPVVWGALYDQGQGYLTAHKLALSPYGQAARLTSKSKGAYGTETTYQTHYEKLVRIVACGRTRVT